MAVIAELRIGTIVIGHAHIDCGLEDYDIPRILRYRSKLFVFDHPLSGADKMILVYRAEDPVAVTLTDVVKNVAHGGPR